MMTSPVVERNTSNIFQTNIFKNISNINIFMVIIVKINIVTTIIFKSNIAWTNIVKVNIVSR